MQETETAARSAQAIVGLPARFMLDGATYRRGGELGFEGFDFYVAGRGGALGAVCAEVVAASFVFFNPEAVSAAWERSDKVMGRLDAAVAFAGCLSAWAASHLPEGVDYERLAELAGQVVVRSSPAGLPLFAAWARLEEPEEPKALALHRLNLLRELRGGLHGSAVLVAGLVPHEAVMVRSPHMAAILGWDEPHPDPEPNRSTWEKAEAATNVSMGRYLSVLNPPEQDELAELASQAASAR